MNFLKYRDKKNLVKFRDKKKLLLKFKNKEQTFSKV